MSLWWLIVPSLLLVSLWLARPLLVRNRIEPSDSEHAISIYNDQLEEIDRDAALGLIDAAQRQQAEEEIRRWMARAARETGAGIFVSHRNTGLAFGTAVFVIGASLGLYLHAGAPDQPLAPRLAQMNQQLEKLRDSARQDEQSENSAQPETFQAWWVRARRYASTGDYASAAHAYQRAAALSDNSPSVVSAYAEALTLANGNKVPAAARLIFEQVLARQPDEPRARYYVALANAQAKNFEGALQAWLALLADSDQQAPWSAIVRRDIANMARFLKRDLRELLPDATADELARAGLDLAASADDAPNWRKSIALARDRAASADIAGARKALDEARRAYRGAPFVLSQIDSAAADLAKASETPRGPSAEQVAAAGEMDPASRDRMVRTMVDGLARRLRTEPSDLDGWLMLIRSYVVLQDRGSAVAAVKDALATFSTGSPRQQVLRSAAELGLAIQ